MVRESAAFLIEPLQVGQPTDYLLARIASRRRELVTDWFAIPESPLAPETRASAGNQVWARGMSAALARDYMRHEFRWVYLQLNQGMRRTMAPVFLWFELRTILVSLRLRRGGERERESIADLLAGSLLAKRVRQLLGEPAAGTDALADLLEAVAEPGRGLGALYRGQKGREYEELFLSLYLERTLRRALHPVLRDFFSAVVDQMNLLALAKLLRWQLDDPHPFIRGGTIATKRLEEALKGGTAAGLAALLRPQPGPEGLAALRDNPEHFLLCRLTRQVAKLGSDPLGVGRILAYLWGCAIKARNAGVVHHAAFLGEETLHAELIG